MPNTKSFTRSFSGGELSPAMFGRIDDAKYQSGAALLRNFIATPQGPAENRPGFAYVLNTKDNGAARLISFVYNNTQTMVLEFGNQYIRFHTMGKTLELTASVPYEISTPYLIADVFDIHYVQSADVMTLVHPSYPPMELSRLGALDWNLAHITFGAPLSAPLSVAVTASPGYLAKIASISAADPAVFTTASSHTLSLGDGVYVKDLFAMVSGTLTDFSGFYLVSNVPVDTDGNLIKNELSLMDYSGNALDSKSWIYPAPDDRTIQLASKVFDPNNYYAVSSVVENGSGASELSATVQVINNLDVPGSYNSITWDAVAGAGSYYIFKKQNGLFGFIGQAPASPFIDSNIAPDFSITPTNSTNPFNGSGNSPAAVGYIEQRRCFAGTNNAPQTLWMTNSGTERTLSYSLPSLDTDRIEIKVAAREVSSIEHIVPLNQLLLLTGSCEYAEYTTSDGPITPNSIGIRPQSYIGASNVQPTVVNNSLVYCAARGGHVREMGYQLQASGYITGDLSLRAGHLFDLLSITDQTFMKAPLPIVWFVSSNGHLLGLTYVPEQQIGAWHHHDTDGVFESITAVAEDSEDRLYAVIRRTINGEDVRFIERMASRLIGLLEDCFFVDAGATYDGVATETISGLDWLEGSAVAVLADGAVQNQKVVTGGSITLDHSASKVQVGLPITADLQTLPPTLQVGGFGQGRELNVNKIWIRLYQSSGIFAGPTPDLLTEYKQRTSETYGTPPSLENGQAEITMTPQWNQNGQIFIRQENPLPLTVVSLTSELSIGG